MTQRSFTENIVSAGKPAVDLFAVLEEAEALGQFFVLAGYGSSGADLFQFVAKKILAAEIFAVFFAEFSQSAPDLCKICICVRQIFFDGRNFRSGKAVEDSPVIFRSQQRLIIILSVDVDEDRGDAAENGGD